MGASALVPGLRTSRRRASETQDELSANVGNSGRVVGTTRGSTHEVRRAPGCPDFSTAAATILATRFTAGRPLLANERPAASDAPVEDSGSTRPFVLNTSASWSAPPRCPEFPTFHQARSEQRAHRPNARRHERADMPTAWLVPTARGRRRDGPRMAATRAASGCARGHGARLWATSRQRHPGCRGGVGLRARSCQARRGLAVGDTPRFRSMRSTAASSSFQRRNTMSADGRSG